jgi:glucan 1,3-beta-glucosidase
MFTALSLASLLAILPVAWSVPTWNTQVPFSPSFSYGSQPVRGVNLGGWLVLEVCYNLLYIAKHALIFCTAWMQPWVTPSLFESTGNPAIVDEWTFGQYQDPNIARTKLTEHWDTWITESDFKAIAAAGCVLACIGASQCAASLSSKV